MAKLNFTYLPGDGIGPEVGGAAINVLQAISSKFRHNLEIDRKINIVKGVMEEESRELLENFFKKIRG